MNIKPGTQLALSTNVTVTVKEVHGERIAVRLPDGGHMWLHELESLGITSKILGKEEPALGSIIRFLADDSYLRVAQSEMGWEGTFWRVDGYRQRYEWKDLKKTFGFADFELLRSEEEIIGELLEKLLPMTKTHSPEEIDSEIRQLAIEHGVTL